MTFYYLDSTTGSDSNNGLSWAGACATMAHVAGLMAAGDSLAIYSGHSESYGSTTTITFPGAYNTSRNFIYSCDKTNAPPTPSDLTPGAAISVASGFNLTINGAFYEYGMKWAIGSGSSASTVLFGSNLNIVVHDTATFDGSACSGLVKFTLTPANGRGVVKGCGYKPGATSHLLNFGGVHADIYGMTLDASVAVPSVLIDNNSNADVYFEGCDFSGLGAHSLVGSGTAFLMWLKDCKLPANLTEISPIIVGARHTISNSIGQNSFSCYEYGATEASENTVTRPGGATDPSGALFSKKVATTTHIDSSMPYYSLPLSTLFNGTTGSAKTITVYGVIAGGTVPNNNDIWLEVEYPKNSGDNLGGVTNPALAANSALVNPLYTGAAVATDSSTWNGGLSSPAPFKLTASITPQQKGLIIARVCFAKASTTYYIDGAMTIT